MPDFRKDKEDPPPGRTADTAPTLPPLERAPAGQAPKPAATGAEGPIPADPETFKLSVNVQLVVVDAVVRDRAGRPMDNLKREDFRLFEDGNEQEIRNFSRDELRRAAYHALMQLRCGDRVALLTFAGEVQRLEDLTTDRQRIADRIATIHAGGGTDIVDALFDAVYYLGMVAPDNRRAVILVSDNQATTKPRASEAHTIRMAMESETVIYSVKTPGEATPLTMRLPNLLGGLGSVSKITRETGGEVIDVGSFGSLDAALATVISRLRLRYTLGYYPSQQARDGTFRKIDVRLADRLGRPDSDYTVHARRGYYSPTDKVTAGKPNPNP